jgi:miniconductance mechanosensitive channel
MAEAGGGRVAGEGSVMETWLQQAATPVEGIHPLLVPFENWIRGNPGVATVLTIVAVLVLGELLHRVVRHLILRFLEGVARQTPQKWDEALFDARLPQRLAWGVPLLVWYYGLLLVPFLPEDPLVVARRSSWRAWSSWWSGPSTPSWTESTGSTCRTPGPGSAPSRDSSRWPTSWGTWPGLILIVAILMDRSPLIFLSGLGAMTAVLLLVFRDTLLSLVAGIQITTNDLLGRATGSRCPSSRPMATWWTSP